MENNEKVIPIKVGDFVFSTIHEYVAFIFVLYQDNTSLVGSIIVDSTNALQDAQEGSWRIEIFSELLKIPPTLDLIEKTMKYLKKLNLEKNLDNLNYIEFINILNEKKKELKNADNEN